MTVSLQDSQQWLLSRLLDGSNQHAQWMLKQTQQLSAQQRLSIYQRGYHLRLIECMKAEFPALNLYLGDELFALFASGYLQRHPSTHYSLYELGAKFAVFLASTRPKSTDSPVSSGLLIPEQLARLERARAVAMRAEGAESHIPLSPTPALLWQPVTLPATTTVVSTNFDLLRFIQDVDQYNFALNQPETKALAQDKPLPPQNDPQELLVFRHNYQVSTMRLEAWQSDIFACLQSHCPHAPPWDRIAASNRLSESALIAKVARWLPTALRLQQIIPSNTPDR